MAEQNLGRAQFLTSQDAPGVFSRIINKTMESSVAMQICDVIDVQEDETLIQLDDLSPTASWRRFDDGKSIPSTISWKNVEMVTDDVDVVVVIERRKVEDAKFNILAEIERQFPLAIARKVDQTVFLGNVRTRAGVPLSIREGATAAGNVVTRGTNTAAQGGLASDISDMVARIEECGFDASAFGASSTFKQFIRRARDTQGNLLADFQGNQSTLWGMPLIFGMKGMLGVAAGEAELFAVDGEYIKIGVQRDFTIERQDSGVIMDEQNNILHNLWQEKKVAFRASVRMGWQIANVTQNSVRGTNERQTLTITGSPTGGTFTVSFRGRTTAPVAHNATGADLQNALQQLISIGPDSVIVTRASNVFTIEFVGDLAKQNVPQVTAAHAFTGGSSPNIAAATTVEGASPNLYPASMLIRP